MISLNKTYTTRSGYPVRILCLDIKDKENPVLGAITYNADLPGEEYEDIYTFTPEGKIFTDRDSDLDLIECNPWQHLKVDTPVLVRNATSWGRKWSKRYFAGVVDGKPTTWERGTTSWSTDGSTVVESWDECVISETVNA